MDVKMSPRVFTLLSLLFSFAMLVNNVQISEAQTTGALPQAITCPVPAEGITHEITMDHAGYTIGYPHNTITTGQADEAYPSLEQGAGRIYENGTWRERPIIKSENIVRYGDAALHYQLPKRQANVPLSEYPAEEAYQDRLETRLIDSGNIREYLGQTYYSGFSLYIPSNVDAVGDTLPNETPFTTIHKWHQSSPESPPISMVLASGHRSRLGVMIHHGVEDDNETADLINRADDPTKEYIDLPLDQWVDLTAEWQLNPFSDDGRFVLYMYDPTQPTQPPIMLYQYKGKLGYTGTLTRSNLMQTFGVHRSANPIGDFEIYFDQIRTGTEPNSVLPWKEESCWRFDGGFYWATKIEMEAEDATLSGGFQTGNDNNASGGQYIHAPVGVSNQGIAEFVFNVTEAGFYAIEGGIYAESGAQDSFFVSVNDQSAHTWDITLNTTYENDFVSNRGETDKVVVYLESGPNTVTVLSREEGARLDVLRLVSTVAPSTPAPLPTSTPLPTPLPMPTPLPADPPPLMDCSVPAEEITHEITMDFPEDRIHYPTNTIITSDRGYPGLEEGSGFIYENGERNTRPIIKSEDIVRYGYAAIYYYLPKRQADVPAEEHFPPHKDRLETRLIDRGDILEYLGKTYYSGFSLYIPSTVDPVGDGLPNSSRWSTIQQWHQSSPESPPIAISIAAGYKSRIEARILYGVDKYRGETTVPLYRAGDPTERYVDLPLNKWVDFTAEWQLNPFSEKGKFVLYMYDPAQPLQPPVLLYQYEGKVGHTGTLTRSHLTQAFGMYRNANPTGDWEIYYDQVRTGTDWNSVLPWKEEACWRFDEDSNAGNGGFGWVVDTAPTVTVGDVNCDDQVDIIDALYIMQHEVQTRTDIGGCPVDAAERTLNLQPGDVNEDSEVNVLDALVIMQCEARIANTFCP